MTVKEFENKLLNLVLELNKSQCSIVADVRVKRDYYDNDESEKTASYEIDTIFHK